MKDYMKIQRLQRLDYFLESILLLSFFLAINILKISGLQNTIIISVLGVISLLFEFIRNKLKNGLLTIFPKTEDFFLFKEEQFKFRKSARKKFTYIFGICFMIAAYVWMIFFPSIIYFRLPVIITCLIILNLQLYSINRRIDWSSITKSKGET